jgi:hypothetical protein
MTKPIEINHSLSLGWHGRRRWRGQRWAGNRRVRHAGIVPKTTSQRVRKKETKIHPQFLARIAA